jgi:hypothetical protein
MRLVSFLILIYFCGFVCSLGSSVDELVFKGKVGEEICNEFNVFSKDTVYFQDKWADDFRDYKKFSEHNLSSNDLGLQVKYENSLVVGGKKKTKVCIKAKEEGFYSGLLLFTELEKNGGVGIWMEVDVNDDWFFEENYFYDYLWIGIIIVVLACLSIKFKR